jgi:hypothetical protein
MAIADEGLYLQVEVVLLASLLEVVKGFER